MSGVLLDPRTGKPDRHVLLGPTGVAHNMEGNYERGWRGGQLSDTRPELDRLPDHIQEMLAKSRGELGPFAGMRPPMADHSNYEVLRYWITADTTLNTIAELIMVPAFNFGPSEMQVGTCLRMTLFGSLTLAITTPGTTTLRMRWGGVAGALQATSDAIIPTATQATTTASFCIEYAMTVRTVGTAGTLWCQGEWHCPGTLETTPASTTIMVTHLKARQIPSSAAAVGAAIDFTATLGPTPTLQQTVSTYTATTHLALLECMN